MADAVIAVAAILIFEYDAVGYFLQSGSLGFYVCVTQLLAVLFLVALYYSVKTLRGIRTQDENLRDE